jgi:DNA-directed RNA polymerase specialized sigma24 family protein
MTALIFQPLAKDPDGRQPAVDLGVLVRQMAKGTGRHVAFAELYERLYGLVVDYAGWLLPEPGAADRVARGTFVEAWHLAHRYRAAEGGVEGWILAIAHSRIGDTGRMRRQIVAPRRPSVAYSLPVDQWIDDCRAEICHDEHLAVELVSLLTPRPPASAARRPAMRQSVRRQFVRRTASIDELLEVGGPPAQA